MSLLLSLNIRETWQKGGKALKCDRKLCGKPEKGSIPETAILKSQKAEKALFKAAENQKDPKRQ